MARTFGWVQNPNRLDTLKNVVSVFVPNSPFHDCLVNKRLPIILKNGLMSQALYDDFINELSKPTITVKYGMLKGKGSGKLPRSKAPCSGIIQAAIDAQKNCMLLNSHGVLVEMKKPYTDDWSADGYLRWAISTGLLKYNRENDTCTVSLLGKQLVSSPEFSENETMCFSQALLSYPPVCRVLDILSDQMPHTKFEIGAKLGFKGEMGFTSIPQAAYVYDCAEAPTKHALTDIKSNTEGDSDKYARTIANWLKQMGWVTKKHKVVCETYLGVTHEETLDAWQITRKGEQAFARSKGYSKNPQVAKIVLFEMLATKVPNADFVRLRRAHILQSLNSYRSLEEIQKCLAKVGLSESIEAIKDEISNFENIGIYISEVSGKFKLADKIIGLDIPHSQTVVMKADITQLKDSIRTKLQVLDHDYLVLVDLAYSDASTKSQKNNDAREFEIQTARLFTEELAFLGERLGNADKPDVIIYRDKFGTIIDNKSYKDGFSVDKKCADEMMRYVTQNNRRTAGSPPNEWWKHFDSGVTEFTFLFVTSFLKGKYQENLEEISQLTGTPGAAIGVDNLLYLAEAIKSGKMSYANVPSLFQNKEICISL